MGNNNIVGMSGDRCIVVRKGLNHELARAGACFGSDLSKKQLWSEEVGLL